MTIHLCGLPGDTGPKGTGAIDPSLRLTLLRVGFTEPSRLPWMLVRSYRTVSPLPVPPKRPSAVYSLLHFPSPYDARALPGTLPCGARTFLPRPKPPAILTRTLA